MSLPYPFSPRWSQGASGRGIAIGRATNRVEDAEPLPVRGHLGSGESIVKPTSKGSVLLC